VVRSISKENRHVNFVADLSHTQPEAQSNSEASVKGTVRRQGKIQKQVEEATNKQPLLQVEFSI
jgi:hypothetical protein